MARSNQQSAANTQDDNAAAAPDASKGAPLVQLKCNAAGHQVGETFKRADAEKLGILDKCRDFTPDPGTPRK